MPEQLQTRSRIDVADPMPLDGFRSAVAQSVVALDVLSRTPETFRGALAGHSSGGLQILAIHAGAHAVHRTPALIGQRPQHYVKFTVVERGNVLIVQDGRESALSAGDMTLYDTDRPYSLICDGDTDVSVVMLPKELLDVSSEAISRLAATRLDGTTGLGAIVRPYLSTLVQQFSGFDQNTARRLSRNAIEMVGTMIEGSASRPVESAHDQLLRRVLDYIDENLSSADLTPPVIAAAHYVSVRHLHALFSDQGTTVSTVVRNRRLERCYDQLVDPRCASRSVTTIALDNGFVDAAHFSRTFRAHFGVPPSSLRP